MANKYWRKAGTGRVVRDPTTNRRIRCAACPCDAGGVTVNCLDLVGFTWNLPDFLYCYITGTGEPSPFPDYCDSCEQFDETFLCDLISAVAEPNGSGGTHIRVRYEFADTFLCTGFTPNPTADRTVRVEALLCDTTSSPRQIFWLAQAAYTAEAGGSTTGGNSFFSAQVTHPTVAGTYDLVDYLPTSLPHYLNTSGGVCTTLSDAVVSA